MASTAEQLSASSSTPERIGRFVTQRSLGRGAQGIVYLAKDSELDRLVAIKTLTRKRQDSNLVQEARNVSKLQHPNIVQLYEIGVHEDVPFLVYQYFEGESLKQRLENSRATKILDAVKITCKVLEGLAYAHSNGIVHRDINPSNILINKNNDLKIMDFGISQSIGTSTTTNEIAGTINYLAPELLSGQSIDGPVDLFSTGLMLHEMLTGQMVFKAENHMAVMYKISNENILPPSKFNQNVDANLDRIVMRSLERDLNQRYKNAEEMRKELQEYLQGFEEEEPATETTESGSGNSTLDFLIRRMQRKQDFPAVSTHISEINSKSSINGMSSANELSNVILEDYALTTKLLRLVNSSFYGQFGGEITTVSRAIIILGYEQVRAAALSIILFEHLKNDQQANELKLETYSSLMSAIIAREQAKTMGMANTDAIETAFIASMFHELGKLLTIYYFPEEYNEIKNLIENQGLEEEKAVKSILGIPYSELGKGIAGEWKLPDVISTCMDKLPEDEEIKGTIRPDEIMQQLSCFANELSAIGRLEENREEALIALEERYKNCLKVDQDKIEKLIDNSKRELKEFTRILNLDTSNVTLFSDLSATVPPAGTQAESTGAELDGQEQQSARQDLIINGISEITNAMLGDYDLNSVLTMVLETIYRGMGFSRVLFCLRDNKNSALMGRFGYGKTVNELIPKFRFPLKKGTNDVIHEACIKGKDFIILDVNSAEYKSRVPDNLRKLTSPRSLVLYPIVINKRVLGLIYADMDDGTTQVSMEALKFFKTLRNQAALAIQQKQVR